MFALTKLVGAVNALADNVLALSATVADVNRDLRGRLALDGTAPLETASLTHQPPQEPPAEGTEANGLATNGRGRRKAAGVA